MFNIFISDLNRQALHSGVRWRTGDSGHKLKLEKFRLAIRKNVDSQALEKVAWGGYTILHHWRLSRQMNKDQRNLIQPHFRPCFEQKFGLATSLGAFQSSLSCDPVLSVMERKECGRSEHLCTMTFSRSEWNWPEMNWTSQLDPDISV